MAKQSEQTAGSMAKLHGSSKFRILSIGNSACISTGKSTATASGLPCLNPYPSCSCQLRPQFLQITSLSCPTVASPAGQMYDIPGRSYLLSGHVQYLQPVGYMKTYPASRICYPGMFSIPGLSVPLSEHAQYPLLALVGLCQHRLPRLHEDISVGIPHHLFRHIRITDQRFRSRRVLYNIV